MGFQCNNSSTLPEYSYSNTTLVDTFINLPKMQNRYAIGQPCCNLGHVYSYILIQFLSSLHISGQIIVHFLPFFLLGTTLKPAVGSSLGGPFFATSLHPPASENPPALLTGSKTPFSASLRRRRYSAAKSLPFKTEEAE